MTPLELKCYLQKEVSKRCNRTSINHVSEEVECSHYALVGFLRNLSKRGYVSPDLRIVCFFINQGLIQLKGGVKNE